MTRRTAGLFVALLAVAAAYFLLHGTAPGRFGAGAAAVDPRLAAQLAALAPQRPGHPDLYVLGIAGDGSERVFFNEVRHLRSLAETRLDAAGRVLLLANHATRPPQSPPVPATPRTVRDALAGLGAVMDPTQDVLLLYVTTHGGDDHRLLLRRPGRPDRGLDARALRAALDASGIRHRVVVLSACYAGGLAPALETPDTLFLSAARGDRPSFGCGTDSVATYFGRAWLVDGLNDTVDFELAFQRARSAIARREATDGFRPSRPQIVEGARIGATLAAWRAAFEPGAPVPYPYRERAPRRDAPEATPRESVPPRQSGAASRST